MKTFISPRLTSSIELHVDPFEGALVKGWAVEHATGHSPIQFHFIVDGQELALLECSVQRPDVRATNQKLEAHRFQITLPDQFLDGQPHRLEFRDTARRLIGVHHGNKVMDKLEFKGEIIAQILGYVDGVIGGAIRGWVLRTYKGNELLQGGAMLQVSCGNVVVGHTRADHHRPDVGKSISATSACGFGFVLPRGLRSGQQQTFRLHVMPERVELPGSPLTCRLVTDAEEARLLDLADRIDVLYREFTKLRREVHDLVPVPPYTVETYGEWFAKYLPALRYRVLARQLPELQQPLVSILCPVYRPSLPEFQQAVESVLAQTYHNWELILVDDGSRDARLTACLVEFAARDPRVRVLVCKKNGGISTATNQALRAAGGEWIAFFDHDDLLVDVALDCMIAHAVCRNADVLYSDEDKVDNSGHYSEPAFKPDWNARMMLSVNYVCHLLMVRKTAANATGVFNKRYDGAQDHDYLLRLSERVAPGAIHHVPEVLYHWRISTNSTAGEIGAKPYAVDAGIACIRDHLARTRRKAEVESIDGLSFYRVRWKCGRTPRVTIIIPYKEEISNTEHCLQQVLTGTNYPEFQVILVDNWSTSHEAAAFAKRAARDRRVSVLRLEEPFNYSRINNLAAASVDTEFLMFMNNDLFVSGKGWLSALVGEALADSTVGAVGGLFFYPNGTVQHAGVILGAGGVAEHAHVGLPPDWSGYAGRRLFAQELSAVTAAGMLVQAAAFRQVSGFDEVNLTVAFNDVDLCLRLRQAGWRIIWTPEFKAEHHESLSRGDDQQPAQETRLFLEAQIMRERWGDILDNDPFYNRNFSLNAAPFMELLPPNGRKTSPSG